MANILNEMIMESYFSVFCKGCHETCEDWQFYCKACDVYYHYDCIREVAVDEDAEGVVGAVSGFECEVCMDGDDLVVRKMKEM